MIPFPIMEYFDKEGGNDAFFKEFLNVREIKDGDNESVISLFDKLSGGYDLHTEEANLPIQRTLITTLSYQIELDQDLTENCSILDIACGTGQVGKLLRRAGYTGNIEGVDGSKAMLHKAETLENVYNNLHHEILTPNRRSSLIKNNYDVVIVCYAFFPNYLGAEHIDMMLDFLRVGGLFLFNLKYDIVDDPADKMMSYIAKIEKKLNKLIENKKCQRLIDCDIDGVSPRLPYLNPVKSDLKHPDFMHEKQICLKKL